MASQSLLGSCLPGPAPCPESGSGSKLTALVAHTSTFGPVLKLSVTTAEAADSREASVPSHTLGLAHRGPEVKPGHQLWLPPPTFFLVPSPWGPWALHQGNSSFHTEWAFVFIPLLHGVPRPRQVNPAPPGTQRSLPLSGPSPIRASCPRGSQGSLA